MLVSTGLLEGVGLLAVISAFMGDAGTPVSLMVGFGVALALVNALLWTRYRQSGRANGIGPLAMRDIDAVTPVLVLGGHALPALLFALSPFLSVAAVVAGMAAVAGGFYWKFVLVTRACHQQGFALPKLPQRGSGINAAPFRPGIGAEVRA
jgi:phenylacetyl-CoA:acceptor oxidoreductase subunit 2